MYKIIIGGIIVTILAIVAFQAIDPKINGNTVDTTTSNKNTTTVESGTYGISGEVTRAGSYVLSGVVTMNDLIEAAGELKSTADERCFFLDSELTAKETYYIPKKYEVEDYCGNDPISKVNINSASESELLNITGVGSTIAKNIIEYRDSDGRFDTLEELKQVSGIGNSTFSKMKDMIILKD